jgi:hypothetical protein
MKLTVTAIVLLVLVAAAAITSTQITVFVIQPIGAVPEGRTLIISRLNNLNFVDSADAFCQRTVGNVSLLCRGAVLARIANVATVHARLPYSEALYEYSTGGAVYAK